MAQALLPLKDLVQAKTRLGGLLRPSERRALAQAMAEDVLADWRQRFGPEGSITLYKPVGCPKCDGTGYRGRASIHELMMISRGTAGLRASMIISFGSAK